jgi:hypothetical protein
MENFEKLGVFYLGREQDPETKKTTDNLILYDSKDLVTHAVCVGMTGSGKTGLCIDLLEEAAIDGIPSIIIDPKGDLPNLLLTFPELRAEDFIPWVNEEEARKKNITKEAYGAEQADLWKKGLASWGQDGERIRRLKESADFVCYTPGSNAGFPISILSSFEAPPPVILEDSEALRDQINTTVTSLLGLLGINADPIQSHEHILISTLLGNAWKNSTNLDLPSLIQQIQTPPVTRIGVLDLESFFPANDRFKLAMQLNNLLAAPGFSTWLEGEPLHIDSILHTTEGKPRVAIFSIAHLNDAERMFFVSLLLNQIVGWMRTQSGTTSLRAIVYMDEIFGYFPPVANPPSKTPLLTMLKQARAYGVGVVLVTQNPVDLDYKGLSNTGTWLIGRLQTERDQARVLDGLEGAMASAAVKFDRKKLETTMAGLGSRMFLMNNVHEDAPVVFESRWAMSYLRGPMTRNQIKLLSDPKKALMGSNKKPQPTQQYQQQPISYQTQIQQEPSRSIPTTPQEQARPILPPSINQFYAPIRGSQTAGSAIVYQPTLYGVGKIYFSDKKANVDVTKEVLYQVSLSEGPIMVNWEEAKESTIKISDLEKTPLESALFLPLPSDASQEKSYNNWNKDFVAFLFRSEQLELMRSPSHDMVSNLDEQEKDFRLRLTQNSREMRDSALEKLREKYTPKITALQEQIRKSQQAVERETEQAKQQKMQTAISIGATILGAFAGRKTISQSTIGRATTSIKTASRSMKESQDIERAKDTVEAIQARLAQMEADFKTDTDQLTAQIDSQTETLEKLVIRPSKTDISVQLIALCWTPYWKTPQGILTPAF